MRISYKNVVVIAPHPDDETLAVGGTIARLAKEGCNVSVLVVSGHLPPLYSKDDFTKTKEESMNAFKLLGVKNSKFAEIPATYVHQRPISEVNSLISKFIKKYAAELVFIPFPDRHIDHRVIFDSSVVACRPVGANPPKMVLSYETLSETHWNVPGIESIFAPEMFFDISDYFHIKKSALESYQSQIKNNDSRSAEACESLARFRGSQNGCKYAEAFKVVRFVV